MLKIPGFVGVGLLLLWPVGCALGITWTNADPANDLWCTPGDWHKLYPDNIIDFRDLAKFAVQWRNACE